MSENQTTRPLTDEQWMYWQKLVSDEHDRQTAEIERLRGLCLPQFEGEIACKHLRLFSPADGDGWVCHWWSYRDADPRKQTFGEGPTIRDAITKAVNAWKVKNV